MNISEQLAERLHRGEREAFEEFGRLIVEQVLLQLPNAIAFLTRQSAALSKLSEKFFNDNSDLASHKDAVRQVLEGLESQNPGKTYHEIIDQLAPATRDFLKRREGPSVTVSGRMQSIEKIDARIGEL